MLGMSVTNDISFALCPKSIADMVAVFTIKFFGIDISIPIKYLMTFPKSQIRNSEILDALFLF